MSKLMEIHQLVKNYDDFSLGPVDLELEPGAAVGLVGANGAGKSTLFRCVMGLVRPNQGKLSVQGEAVSRHCSLWKQHIAYLGDYNPFFEKQSGHWNLATSAGFYPRWNANLAESLASRLRLDLATVVKNYSTGQRSKLALIRALAQQPRLLLLDEPSTGLDPVSREILLETLFDFLADADTALLYATHHVAEIEGLADRLVFMHNGQIVRDAIKEDLLEKWRGLSFRCDHELPDIPHAQSVKSELPWRQVISDDSQATLAFLKQQGVTDVEVNRLSTEQIAVRILRQTMGDHHVY